MYNERNHDYLRDHFVLLLLNSNDFVVFEIRNQPKKKRFNDYGLQVYKIPMITGL